MADLFETLQHELLQTNQLFTALVRARLEAQQSGSASNPQTLAYYTGKIEIKQQNLKEILARCNLITLSDNANV